MKFLERFALTIFSIIILILSIVMLCIMFGVADFNIIKTPISYIMEDIIAYRTALVVITIFILLSIKGIFFKSKKENLGKDGIVLENASGKLVISKESLENLVASVAKEIPGAEAVTSRTILDKDRNLKVYVTTVVSRDMMLKDVSSTLQDKIKEAMKQTADLDVKEVNIRIKNISSKKIKNKVQTEVPAQNVAEESKEEKTEGEE
jgi:uncharacterized alkaline shock family protein YloU